LYDIKIEGVSDLPLNDGGSMVNMEYNFSNNFNFIESEEDFTDLYDGVSHNSEEWFQGLALEDEDPMITTLELHDNSNTIRHQVYAMITLATS
jgi:hypothetical protein